MEPSRTLSSCPAWLLVAEKHRIFYCGIPKTGSTFWRRTLNIVENGQRFSSLYEFRNSHIKIKSLPLINGIRSKYTETTINSLLKNSMTFTFVREPYGRIFSAYNNKILNPNIMYWRLIGRKVVRTIRNQTSPDSLEYGHDVTFAELIQFLIFLYENQKGIDQHFSPMYKKCNPCEMQFDYLGKMESFYDDAHFIIAKLRKEFKDVYVQFGDFDTDTALDTAQGHVKFLYQALKATEGINYPIYNFFLRTWRDLQIRGHLSKHIDMPLSRAQASNITKEEFFELIKEALAQPMDRAETKEQRNEAMIQAYRTIPMKDLERLSKYVEQDCLLFGYDIRPAKLFDRENVSYDDNFNYFDTI